MRSLLSTSTGLLLTAALVGTVPSAFADSPSLEVAPAPGVAQRAAPAPAALAGGAVVLGTTGTTGAGFVGFAANVSLAQATLAPGSPSYTVPGAGVLTSVSHDEGVTAGMFRLLLLGPGSGPTARAIRGYTPKLNAPANTLSTYPVRIPVIPGTELGIYTETGGMSSAKTSANLADSYGGTVVDPTTVPEFMLSSTNTLRLVNISAVWEPDVDGDGYGDVSQDLCPQSKLSAAACPAPDTTVTKKPKKSSTKRKAKIKFTSSVPGSTFTCAVDGKAAKPCASPFKKKFKYGKHKVVITATSPAGIVDATPVTVKFKVKRPTR